MALTPLPRRPLHQSHYLLLLLVFTRLEAFTDVFLVGSCPLSTCRLPTHRKRGGNGRRRESPIRRGRVGYSGSCVA